MNLLLARRAARRLTWPRNAVVHRPVAYPAHWQAGPPHFIGVGVQKAGTSWWHRLITAHPQVFYSDELPKELHYFDRFSHAEFRPVDVAAYHEFCPVPPGMITGEWTPRYMADFWVPELLSLSAPRAKLLIMLRDPVERYQSGITHEAALGARPRPIVAAEAHARGYYSRQLQHLLTFFPASQMLILQYERCRRDPLGQLRRTYDFLGLDEPGFCPPNLHDRVNETSIAKLALPSQIRATLIRLYEPDVERLTTLVPDLDLTLWPNFLHLTLSDTITLADTIDLAAAAGTPVSRAAPVDAAWPA